jgi:peptidoglycan hydrolase-like protein with peptidoglycan-binding domain
MARQELVRVFRAVVALAAMAVLIVPAAAEAKYAKRTLAQGSQGSDVKQFQKYLKRAGFKTQATGYYGSQTTAAERAFESQDGRTVNGTASPTDQKAVRKAAKAGATKDSESTGGQGYEPPQGNPSERAVISADGRTAIAPDSAPQEVKDAIAAANKITSKPYKYGGGHGKWKDSGYDCSGSVSFAMIAGLRFDTSSQNDSGGESGPRWRAHGRSSSGYVARHPSGL